MPLSIIIYAPVQEVFDVLNTPELNSVWNPLTKTVTPINGKPNECTVETFMGDFETKKVTVGNSKVTITCSPKSTVLEELTYDLVALSKKDTSVEGNVKLVGHHYTTMHQSVGESLLRNLKRYVEHIHTGGSNANFQKVP